MRLLQSQRSQGAGIAGCGRARQLERLLAVVYAGGRQVLPPPFSSVGCGGAAVRQLLRKRRTKAVSLEAPNTHQLRCNWTSTVCVQGKPN